MRVLLDTCVLSEIRHPQGAESVKNAVQSLAGKDLFISVISIGEIVKGINCLNESKRKQELQSWVQGLERFYSERILPLDLKASQIWGELTARMQKEGKVIPACDGLIASTAIRHGLHVMTRNTSDFELTGAMIVNPWQNGNNLNVH